MVSEESLTSLCFRWSAVMQTYLPWRSQFQDDALALAQDLTGPLTSLLDIGSGPGDFPRRTAIAWPRCRLVAMDDDARVVALTQHHLRDRALVVQDDVLVPGWAERVTGQSGGPFDAVLASAVMHIVGADRYESVVAEARRTLRVGGVFIDIDEMPLDTGSPTLARCLAARRDTHVQARLTDGQEDYRSWRAALLQVMPEVETAPEVYAAAPRSGGGDVEVPTAQLRVAALLRSGFREASVVLRQLDTAVIVALR